MLGELFKCVPNILSCHGRGLAKIVKAILLHAVSAVLSIYNAVVGQINSVSNQVYKDIVICVVLNLINPSPYVVKAFLSVKFIKITFTWLCRRLLPQPGCSYRKA